MDNCLSGAGTGLSVGLFGLFSLTFFVIVDVLVVHGSLEVILCLVMEKELGEQVVADVVEVH